MFIKRISLQNFKSFYANQTLTVGHKNLIIGKNGSGKSNLLSALSNLFLFGKEKRPQYNNNEELSTIEVEIDNSDRRFLLSNTFVLKIVYKEEPEYIINDRPISKEELKGLLENAGFNQECFVMQGKVNDISVMSPIERYDLIKRIAGVERYEDSKSLAINLLNEENENKVEGLIEKIEMKMKVSEEYKRKVEEYDRLVKEKADFEFEMLNYELKGLNEEIERIEMRNNIKGEEEDENLVEFEIKAIKEEMNGLIVKKNESEEFLSKFDETIVSQLKSAINSKDTSNNNNKIDINPYDSKVNNLEKSLKESLESLKQLENNEREKYIELNALKFLDAMPIKNESLEMINKKLESVRTEISTYSNNSDNLEDYKDLVSQRKKLWIKEKKLKEELKITEENEKKAENKMLYLGKLPINVYENLKNSNGVIGPVFSLFEVPENLADSFEAVARNSLFWIVVENEEIATKLVKTVEGRVTFVALNRISNYLNVHSNVPIKKLSEFINCDIKYKNLLEMICKNYYLYENINDINTNRANINDINTSRSNIEAIHISEKYNINLVTNDGDIFNRNGSITGGFENSFKVLRDLKLAIKTKSSILNELQQISIQITALNDKIQFLELQFSESFEKPRILENLLALEKCLILKAELLKKRKILIPEISQLQNEHKEFLERIPSLKLEIEKKENLLSRTYEKKGKIDELIEEIRFIDSSTSQLTNLKEKEKKLIDSLYLKKANENIEESGKLLKKHHLIDRRTQLMEKIGISDFKAIFIKNSKEFLITNLKEINKKLKKFSGFSKRELLDDQRSELKAKLEELKDSKIKILEFISTLDKKKEDTFNLSFSMISENYAYFYKKITGKTSALLLGNKTVEISLDGKIADLQSLSGGQKTVIALSIIFAIQKNDPSPFYVFDEIDANLDLEYCIKLGKIIEESDSQYFISSFKNAMIDACNKYFGVVLKDKQSFVDEIDKELAREVISE